MTNETCLDICCPFCFPVKVHAGRCLGLFGQEKKPTISEEKGFQYSESWVVLITPPCTCQACLGSVLAQRQQGGPRDAVMKASPRR
jgi:hypothetical protein